MQPEQPTPLSDLAAAKPGPDVRGALDREHALGALLGLAVGDALGATTEFTHPAAVPFPRLMTGPLTEIVGGGPHHVAVGQVTDDTQMAVVLAQSLLDEGEFRAAAVAAGYAKWVRHAFDAGNQTRAVLARIARGMPAEQASREVWESQRPAPAGNGSLMRTVPIAVFHWADPERRRAVSLDESALTHFDPRCRLACAAFNAAVALALPGGATAVEMARAAGKEVLAAAAALERQHPDLGVAIGQARQDLQEDLAAAEREDPDLYGDGPHLLHHQGFVRVAFRLAFWHLRHTDSLPAALIDVVNRGGDTDTNAAITGALLGARLGRGAIPARWIAAVTHALEGQPGPMADDYHPRRLLALVPAVGGT